MSVTYANINPAAVTDGIPYATAQVLTGTEADIYNNTTPTPDPVGIAYWRSILATLTLSITGAPDAQSTYVVMQTDLGDGVWVDVAWIVWTGTSGSAVFALAGGALASSLAVVQSRAVGTAPGTNGSNQLPLGGRVRFVGKSTFTNGTAPAVAATLKYKGTGLN